MPSKKSQGPLLYIHQPFTRTPSNKMQDIFTNKSEELQEELVKEEHIKKIPVPKKEDFNEPIPIDVTKTENQQAAYQEKHRSSFNRVKSFKELDIKERLEYLINFPKVLPPVPCLFNTGEKSIQGYLSKYQDDQVTIKFHDQTTETLAVHEIKDIIMIGIKK